ncbi:MAG: polysaccharide deacetylase family protein [Candidatus Carbobacillus altaicus]|uniref:Cellobiose phosphotransferase system celC n=1 Tax=Candidatus Carbonibacillus altaicus TaxID=2163959 RepID=A0A2R6XYF3_9BACL|nr:polysaccharide deacetylase family protein [Candidatus Carbobacillus altaicus]PTQ55461.1 MAG: cellobiose phosphotransferase system celC [Candidatus Carbobacillus altaicus]
MAEKRYLILNCDDFGQSEEANQAIQELLDGGYVSSASIMPPAPYFDQAAEWVRKHPDVSIGLHLTFTSEYRKIAWRSLTHAPSLEDAEGFMHETVRAFEEHARLTDVWREIRAQFARVKLSGVPLTHVDNHMGSLYGLETGRSFLPLVFWESGRRGLPFRLFRDVAADDPLLSGVAGIEEKLPKVVALADVLGAALPDYLLSHPYASVPGETYDDFKTMLIQKIYHLPPGISEIYIHPATPSEHLKSFLPAWEKRVWEYRLVQSDDFRYALKDAGVELVTYRTVKEINHRSRWQGLRHLVRTK